MYAVFKKNLSSTKPGYNMFLVTTCSNCKHLC